MVLTAIFSILILIVLYNAFVKKNTRIHKLAEGAKRRLSYCFDYFPYIAAIFISYVI